MNERSKKILSIILIVLAGFCAYGNSIGGQFLFDDETLITENVYITHWSYLPDVFKKDIGAGAGKVSNPYRPFQILTYMVDHSLWELDPRGYHLTNIVFHVLTALGLYWLMNILFADGLLALLTGLFFVVHPIHTQAVSYVAGRADSLAALFMLISMICYVRLTKVKRVSLSLLMVISYILAILSRENSLIFPLLLLMVHYVFEEKRGLKNFFLMAGVALGYMVLRSVFFKHLMPDTVLHDTTFLQRLPGFFVAITRYVQLLVLPVGLHMEYGDKLFTWADPRAIVGGLALLSLLILAVRLRRRNRLILFGLLWFLITLIPASNLYPINAYMAEHWLYLPSMGIFLIISQGLCLLLRRDHIRNVMIVVCVGFLGFYAFLTFRQNAVYWSDPVKFYQRTLEFAPDSFKANNNLGKIYHELGRTEEAIPLFTKAIEINPRDADAYNNLAAVSYVPGKNDEEIIRLFKEAVRHNPKHAKAYYNLGKLYADTGDKQEAAAALKKAVELNPNYVEAYGKLGVIYGEIGKYNEAIAVLKKAIELNPADAVAHINLAVAYYYTGDKGAAARQAQKAKELGGRVSPAFLQQLRDPMPLR